MNTRIIDAHCHFFNKDIITRRIIQDLIQLIKKLIQQHKQLTEKTVQPDAAESFKDTITRILHFLDAGIESGNSTEVFKKLDKVYKDNNLDTIFTPLMFDLEFCFHENYEEAENHYTTKSTVKRKEFAHLSDLQDELKRNLDLTSPAVKNSGDFKDISEQLKYITDKINIIAGKTSGNDSIKPIITGDNSFNTQLDQIIELKKNYPKQVFPFLVVDPRRKRIIEMAKELISMRKIFYGIKLYCPNGYSPTDTNLYDGNNSLYAFCEKYAIPITVHCSSGGFATFVKDLELRGDIFIADKPDDFTNPKGKILDYRNKKYTFKTDFVNEKDKAVPERALALNFPPLWEKVLDKYKNLYLNLAHFGGDLDNSIRWRNEIYRLISKKNNDGTFTYPNLYTDISCITNKEILLQIKTNYFDKDKTIQSKFMYGSDFYLNLIYAKNMDQYIKNFRSVFQGDDFNKIARDNPNRFLFLNRTTVPVNQLIA